MRLFIACGIPERVRREMAGLQGEIGDKNARIKWVEPNNMHMTLRFLGEVDASRADRIIQGLRQVRQPPFEASMSGFGAFPSDSYVRVLFASLAPAERFGQLHDSIDSALAEHGFRPESRFTPHLTLGRVRSVLDKHAFSSQVKELRARKPASTEPFTIDSFSLKRSTLTPKGPIYGDLEVFTLA